MTTPSRHLLLAAILSFSVATIRADNPKIDAQGDPLPAGALARLGTTRWRAGATIILSAFLDDRTILTVSQDYQAQVWDLEGREVRKFDVGGQAPDAPNLLRVPTVLNTMLAAISGDGRRLVAHGRDARLRVWDVAAGRESRTVDLGGSSLSRMAISHDGTRLAFQASDRRLGLCDTTREGPVRWLIASGEAPNQFSYRLDFARDNKHLLQMGLDFNGNSTPFLRRWDADKGTSEQLPLPSEVNISTVARAVVAPDHSMMAGVAGTAIVLVDLKTGKLAHRIDEPGIDLRARLTFSPDSKLLIAIMGSNRAGIVWDVASRKEIARFGSPAEARGRTAIIDARLLGGISVSPDSTMLLAPHDAAVILYDLKSGVQRSQAGGHVGTIRSAAFDATGQRVITRANDLSIREWDAATGRALGVLNIRPNYYSYVNSPDGRWLGLNDSTGTFRVVEVPSGRSQVTLTGESGVYGHVGQFSPDSRLLAHVSRTSQVVALYDTGSGELRSELRLPEQPVADPTSARLQAIGRSVPNRMWFSPDSRVLAVGSAYQLSVWDCTSGNLVGLLELRPTDAATHVAVAPDCCGLATAALDGSITIWEVATGGKRLVLGEEPKRPSASRPSPQVVIDAAGYPAALAFSPDGRFLAAARPDHSIQLWDVARKIVVTSLVGHTGAVQCLTFSADGLRLLSGSSDSTALIWDLAPVRARLSEKRTLLDAQQVESCWGSLLDASSEKAFAAIVALAGDPAASVAFLRQRLRVEPGPDAARLTRLVGELDHPRYAVRERASRELTSFGELAAPALRGAAQNEPSAECRRQARQILDRITYQPPRGERLRTLRALEVLERAGTPGAVALLRELAQGAPVSIPTLQARAALERLGQASK